MKLKRRGVKRGRVEIIPMIDTILILLIFYMSFSTFSAKEKRIDSKLPLIAKASAANTAPTEVPFEMMVHVQDKDHMTVNGTAVDINYLRNSMLQYASTGQKANIVIDGESDTSYEAVIAALDACAEAHMTNVAFRPLAQKVAEKAPEK